jgi:hypothetical protein
LEIPSPPGKPGRLIRIDTCRAKIDEVSGKGVFQRPILETAEIGVVRNLHGPQVAITGKVLIETTTSPAVDTTIHFVLDKDAQVLITISPLFPEIAPDSVAAGNRHVLEQTVAAFVADRTVVGMVHHEPFDHVPTEIDNLFVRGRYGHAIASVHHAAHLYPFDRAFQELHGTHPTGTDRPESLMVAESWDDDAQPCCGLDHFRSLVNLYLSTVNLELHHKPSTVNDEQRTMNDGRRTMNHEQKILRSQFIGQCFLGPPFIVSFVFIVYRYF